MDLATLATAGATTVVGLMATDAWVQVSDRFGRLVRRRGGSEPAASRVDLLVARADGDTAAEARLVADWRDRLRAVLEADPAAAEELAALLDEVNPGWRGGPGPVTVHNDVSGGTVNGPVFQAQRLDNVHVNWSPPQGGSGT
ncbi:hypothetical protein [Streptomyces sp. NPDC012888]|uniref:hypothetical protein n=1 Tax=Streptomyces sp. NPDC012888 TaxID=3364855 RepID=UPI0036952CAA